MLRKGETVLHMLWLRPVTLSQLSWPGLVACREDLTLNSKKLRVKLAIVRSIAEGRGCPQVPWNHHCVYQCTILVRQRRMPCSQILCW